MDKNSLANTRRKTQLENDVKIYGIQTGLQTCVSVLWFENDVNSYVITQCSKRNTG